MQYVGKNYGQDISNEVQNKITVNIVEPVLTPEVTARHAIRERMIRTRQSNIQTYRSTKRTILKAAVTVGIDNADPMKLAILKNAIAKSDYEANVDVPIIMTDLEKTQSSNEWRTYRERNVQLTKHRGKVFLLILRQCTQLPQDTTKQDT